ncbi:putative LRR receptor-like serine/threonine-protein kinase-like [Dorcoceras hygrometricum]|uniref:Putative LRR receptor-like serine/threonine-protein kinase-like n=1 Tax=Dorcoceras hygrometricum TaxID=472368 RepID=A0A2Z7B0T5_9LAMI|nr:putative LRR receptor-like serine/threonine-protein kinase-like [Dorcoceras hygrometricum]
MHADSTTHSKDLHVLKQLKAAINPATITPGSCIYSWDFTLDPCDSLFTEKFTCGFRCDVVLNSVSRVTEIELDSAGYSASLTAISWNLPYLENLDLSNNNFAGPIPGSFSRLTRLQRLALSHNSLSKAIPATLGSLPSLEQVYLDNNKFEGGIPPSFNGMNNLKRLELQGNNLGGAFPDLDQLVNLNFLDASDNEISGQLPASLPPSVFELIMRNNQIEGNLPLRLANLAYLQVFDLSHNKLSGSVPASLFTHPSLQQLTLSFNQFGSIQVPVNLGLTSQLISVDLSNNDIHGFLPGFMGLMPKLSALSLENNEFSGFIPSQYVLKVLGSGSGQNVAQFERLLLGGNYLFGPIPGPFLELKPGSVMVRLGNNCLYRCPVRWFFCDGGVQKSLTECRGFGALIP